LSRSNFGRINGSADIIIEKGRCNGIIFAGISSQIEVQQVKFCGVHKMEEEGMGSMNPPKGRVVSWYYRSRLCVLVNSSTCILQSQHQ